MENFFFISLGITFGLILLLVYHFKQRISSVERRGDTMFELLTNVVKELQFMKSLNSYYENVFQKSAVSTPESKSVPEIDVCLFHPPEKKVIDVPISRPADLVVSKIPVSESESESDSDSEVSELSETETESDDESVDSELEEIHLGVEDVDSKLSEVESRTTVLVESYELLSESLEDAVLESVVPEPVEVVVSEQNEVVPEQTEVVTEPVEVVVSEQNEVVTGQNEVVTAQTEFAEPTREQKRDIYRKMNITQLRGMATAAGIAGDLAKLKKAEIIKLLENLDE